MEQSKATLVPNKLYQLITWESKINSIIAVALINAFFYYYIMLENSLINLISRGVICYTLYKVLMPKKAGAS